ncbi:class I SAM-dependent methyltransferase [Nostoc sp. MS1]|uniref:class I SAM-dependent methyltransferase n=1 Tax=Nostoc sp. MS1 TaxID=2764711 RepID=UPI001CC5001B|nr:class I SAM-dependent methyltransferase [Nostoc sp. MS1]BCL39342.1 SAM-dependent methyltransferase [Nostoc sp. MS1]
MQTYENDQPISLDAYETLADDYAAVVDSNPYNAYYERPTTRSLLGDVEGKRVLDAGSGSGSYSEWLVNRGADVFAIEVSPKLVQFSRQRLGERVEVRQADLRKPLDFLQTASFDLIVCPLVLHYIEDWSNVLAEFHRILKQDGYLVFSIHHPWMEITLLGNNYFETELVEDNWKRRNGEYVKMRYFRRPLSQTLSSLAQAGFEIEQLVEPQPTEECQMKYPAIYEQLSLQPWFLCIRARKK